MDIFEFIWAPLPGISYHVPLCPSCLQAPILHFYCLASTFPVPTKAGYVHTLVVILEISIHVYQILLWVYYVILLYSSCFLTHKDIFC